MHIDQLKSNYQEVLAKIEQAGQPNPTVKLIAVTKSTDSETMRQLYQLGQRAFGENRVDTLLAKQKDLADLVDIEWHYIGRVQSRQVKSIINQIDYLHSLDRPSLAKEIQKRANKVVKCFFQVNVSGEASKAGYHPEEVLEVIEQMAQYDRIQIVGLMTMAPYEAERDELVTIFQTLRQLRGAVAAQDWSHAPCQELSMGMSRDYQIAIEAGASYVRVGSALFK